MAMPVVVVSPTIYAWTWKDEGLKVAKIYIGTTLYVIKDLESYYQIEKLSPGTFDSYPSTGTDKDKEWWIRKAGVEKVTIIDPGTIPDPVPTPQPSNIFVPAVTMEITLDLGNDVNFTLDEILTIIAAVKG